MKFMHKILIASHLLVASAGLVFGCAGGIQIGENKLPPLNVVEHICPIAKPSTNQIRFVYPTNGVVTLPAAALAPWLSPAKQKALFKPLPTKHGGRT